MCVRVCLFFVCGGCVDLVSPRIRNPKCEANADLSGAMQVLLPEAGAVCGGTRGELSALLNLRSPGMVLLHPTYDLGFGSEI
jgi:hypothetical protein